jgi:hypothetical protein
MTRSRARGAAVLAAALGLLLVACGDDDDGGESAATEAPATGAPATDAPDTTTADTEAPDTTAADGPTDTTGGTGAGAGTGDFCEDGPALDRALAAEEPDPAEVEEAVSAVEASAPEEIADAVSTGVDAVRTLLDTGDFSVFESPEVTQALADINGYYVSDCGFNAFNVTAVEYAYQGVDESVPAGGSVLTLTNEGTELHEAILFRINDDVTESVDELLALPEAEVETKVTEAGAAFAFPGQAGSTTLELEPGRYAMVCFIPVGLTPQAAEEAEATGVEPEGPPHFTEGMVQEFTVE